MKKPHQRPKTALRPLDAATLVHVTGGDGTSTGQPSGKRQHDPTLLGEKGAWD